MSAVESERVKQREEEEREQNYENNSITSLKDQVDKPVEEDNRVNSLNNQDGSWKVIDAQPLMDNLNGPTVTSAQLQETAYTHLARTNSDTNIAVAALFEIAARTDASRVTHSTENRKESFSSRNESMTALNARHRKFRRQWNSKMTPEEVHLAYLHRMKEESESAKEVNITRRKRKKELSDSQDEKISKDGYFEKDSFEEQHDKWPAPPNSSSNKDVALGSKSDSDDSDILEGTDSSGNGNGSSNDNNTGTGSGSGSNHGHSVKNPIRRSPALSTFEKNAEVDIWRRMNFKSDDYVDKLDSNKFLSLSGVGSSFSDLNQFLAPSISSNGTASSHRKKMLFGERCSAEERKEKLERYRRKREERIFRKQVRYDVRKRLAESRPRVHGRFCKPSEQQTLSHTQNDK
ncbi:hypothetical protein Gasu2_44220 [Galdieria sulphuraria]|uniref:CCT domain-containing protein n=1 Tax=Galdieria sulphuraria TaxID=130081 RepID=M2Y6P7_GALSU|nr:uncharacterized protein Gasu_12040 [Galdieria sulphuraria]EME31529.1 hypothetical protein Gasu_12040 [Galdieria sulphuraria]GJD10215.1 hypothetical protein Gasu2_44220 [Galdieria sulphuraria]|eukprot:XP_005708049.1 hypothetical protein Gasu_12040 [Galdieria sulphuraria]